MSTKLVFQDSKGNSLYDKDIIHDGSAPLPVPNELVLLPDGKRITVIRREIAYSESQGGATDMRLIFVCKDEVKHTGGRVPTKEF